MRNTEPEAQLTQLLPNLYINHTLFDDKKDFSYNKNNRHYFKLMSVNSQLLVIE